MNKAYTAALKLGIPEKNIHVYSGKESLELNLQFNRLRDETIRLQAFKGKKVFFFVYCTGNGVKGEDDTQ